ncbi:MAG: DNA repair protein RecO [bacterium]
MSEKVSAESIILKRWDYAEKDQIVSFVTADRGRLQGIAKGAKASRHRFAGSLDLFCHSRVIFREKKNSGLVVLEEAKLIEGFPRIRSDYNAILLASGLLEMSYRFYHEGDRACPSFGILLKALRYLEGREAKREIFWRTLLNNLDAIGLAPQFFRCVRCDPEASSILLGFDPIGGGMICNRCTGGDSPWMKVPDSLLHWLKCDGEQGAELCLEETDETVLGKILRHHVKMQMDLDLEWNRFLQFS